MRFYQLIKTAKSVCLKQSVNFWLVILNKMRPVTIAAMRSFLTPLEVCLTGLFLLFLNMLYFCNTRLNQCRKNLLNFSAKNF